MSRDVIGTLCRCCFDDHWITYLASPSEAIDVYGEFKRTFSRVDVGLHGDEDISLCDDFDDVDLCDDKDQPLDKVSILNAFIFVRFQCTVNFPRGVKYLFIKNT